MKDEIAIILRNDYERIADTVYWLDNKVVLKFIVKLNNYVNDNRRNFHSEFTYGYNGYNCIGISRDYKYHLSLEYTERDSGGNKLSLMITHDDLYYFKYKLSIVCEWFTNNNIFAKKDDKIIIPSKKFNERIDLKFGDYIEIEPSIINKSNDEQIIGVNFYLNGVVNFFMSVDRLLPFNYFISQFNMLLSAQLMLAYIGMNEYGINLNNGNFSYNKKKNQSNFLSKVNAVEK